MNRNRNCKVSTGGVVDAVFIDFLKAFNTNLSDAN